MGREKYQKRIEELLKKSPVVAYKSIEMIVKDKGYTKQLIRNLLLKGKIKKIIKGYYTFLDDNSLGVFCFKPAYLGLQDALSFHNLWEQETIPVIITARKARQGIRNIISGNALVRRIGKKYLFGFDYYSQGDLALPYSDVEKTLIDMVYFRERISEETLEEIKKKIDIKKVKSYLKNYPGMIKKRVMNLLK